MTMTMTMTMTMQKDAGLGDLQIEKASIPIQNWSNEKRQNKTSLIKKRILIGLHVSYNLRSIG